MKHFLVLSVLLLGASWAAAQNYPSQTPNERSPSQATPSSAGDQTSVQGCLSGSDGNYTLTDSKGTTYQLTGDTAKLSEHVGHEVKVMGTPTSASAGGASGGTMGQTSNSAQQAFAVRSVKHISKTCQKSDMSH